MERAGDHECDETRQPDTVQGQRIRLRGQVQGFECCPFTRQLAQRFGMTGRMLNDPEGVLIETVGDRSNAATRLACPAEGLDPSDR